MNGVVFEAPKPNEVGTKVEAQAPPSVPTQPVQAVATPTSSLPGGQSVTIASVVAASGLSATQVLQALAKAKGLNYVGTRGDPKAPIWVLGEAPGADEDQAGLPFVGASGKELGRMLEDAGLRECDVCFSNPYKLRPPSNDLDRLGEHGIPLELYHNQFFEELSQYKPTIIICAGATSLGLLCPQTIDHKDHVAKITKWRGSILTSPLLKWTHYVIPMYHPAFVLREWSERQVSVFCLARAKEEFDFFKANSKLNPLPERQLIIQPSYETAAEYLVRCLHSEAPISIDIELLRRQIPYTIAFALSPFSAISICFGDYNDDWQRQAIWSQMDQILRRKYQIGQNYISFDCVWLDWMGFRPTLSYIHDTLVLHHVLWPEFEHKLQFLTFQYTREPFYKDEGRLWKPKDGIGPLMRYNALDAAVTYEAFLRMSEELEERSK